jgi:hypothetical protein
MPQPKLSESKQFTNKIHIVNIASRLMVENDALVEAVQNILSER